MTLLTEFNYYFMIIKVIGFIHLKKNTFFVTIHIDSKNIIHFIKFKINFFPFILNHLFLFLIHHFLITFIGILCLWFVFSPNKLLSNTFDFILIIYHKSFFIKFSQFQILNLLYVVII